MTAYVLKTGPGDGWRWSGQLPEDVGMRFAPGPDESDHRFNAGRGGVYWVSGAETITGLDSADSQVLLEWLSRARFDGIDTIMDFASRPWRIDGPRAIVGVFETKKDQASWLIMRYWNGWILIDCADGFISDVSAALPDILALINASRIRRNRQRPI
jgi:hypothetical protein